jgi:RNA polymerase sigma-70 factor (ECF subfamily)
VAVRRAPSLASETSTEPTAAVDERDAIRRALAKLPIGQREALVLCDWLGMTDAQAGSVLDISAGAARTRLHRARESLRRSLERKHE